MLYFDPKVSIEACLCHRHVIRSYGDGFMSPDLIGRLEYNSDLRHNALLSDIAHIDVSVFTLRVASQSCKTLIYRG
jgi:hypothetical protein